MSASTLVRPRHGRMAPILDATLAGASLASGRLRRPPAVVPGAPPGQPGRSSPAP
ncbi:hypothetical protein OG607_16975 [Streptomyces sp. NBC_01537]|uniref:hypothetical protein n=1 Tax=Streptomyces sp. NBC_01537 TaxID=2903896 RepID=UPI00386F1C62